MIAQRSPWLPVLAALLSLCWSTRLTGIPASETKVEVESGVAQLFVDDFLIDVQTGLKRTLHQPRKDDEGQCPGPFIGPGIWRPGLHPAGPWHHLA